MQSLYCLDCGVPEHPISSSVAPLPAPCGMIGNCESPTPNSRVERVRVAAVPNTGILIGPRGTVTGCTVVQNLIHGINLGDDGSALDNLVFGNKGSGILTGEGVLIRGNISNRNGTGITTNGGTVISNTLHSNEGSGLAAPPGGVVGYAHNTITANKPTLGGGGTFVEIGTNLCDGNTTCP